MLQDLSWLLREVTPPDKTAFLLFSVVQNLGGLTSHFQARSVTPCFLSECHNRRASHAMSHCKCCLTAAVSPGRQPRPERRAARGAVRAPPPLRQHCCSHRARGWDHRAETHTDLFGNAKNQPLQSQTAQSHWKQVIYLFCKSYQQICMFQVTDCIF